MAEFQTGYLKDDVYSLFKREKQYGSRGDRVKIISDRSNVLIVEGPSGGRFPVETNKVIKIEK